GKARSPPTRGRARPSCASPSASMRRPSQPTPQASSRRRADVAAASSHRHRRADRLGGLCLQHQYETILESEQIVKLSHQINKTKDAINVLRAEYAHLARPDRIQALAEKLLQMQPLALNQIVRPQDIPLKSAEADSIGRE